MPADEDHSGQPAQQGADRRGSGTFTFQPGPSDYLPSGDASREFRDEESPDFGEEGYEDEPIEEDDTTTLSISILGRLAEKEQDPKLRKRLYLEMSQHLKVWQSRHHQYTLIALREPEKERKHLLEKHKIIKRAELRAGFGGMLEQVVPVIQKFAEWALPAALVFLLAKWMTSSYWMKSEEAARSLKELMVMIMAGALGWAAHSGVKSMAKDRKNRPTEASLEGS